MVYPMLEQHGMFCTVSDTNPGYSGVLGTTLGCSGTGTMRTLRWCTSERLGLSRNHIHVPLVTNSYIYDPCGSTHTSHHDVSKHYQLANPPRRSSDELENGEGEGEEG